MGTIEYATEQDIEEILALYKAQLGREFCPWDDEYPGLTQIHYDLSRHSLLVMREALASDDDGTNPKGRIIAAITIDADEKVESLPYWTRALQPGCELSRLAVAPDQQNQGIARQMILHAMDVLRERGFVSVHFLVNRLNVKALRSYDKLGFATVGEVEFFDQPMLCYEKKL